MQGRSADPSVQVIWSSDSELGELKSIDASTSQSQCSINSTEDITLEIYTQIAHHITNEAIEQGLYKINLYKIEIYLKLNWVEPVQLNGHS